MNGVDDGSACPGCGEASSSNPAQEASHADKGKGKVPVEKDNEWAEFIGNESDSELDLEDHEMIDNGKN